MPTIQAWQHIYSNVEKEQSPQGRGGFQTLFYSHAGLSEREIEEMEGRLLYFPSDVEPVKRLFFTISSGKGVVAQVVFLPMPDQFGRGGRYLAHSLVFEPELLAQIEVDPFRVFAQFSFISSVDQALQQGDFNSGNIQPVSLTVPTTLTGDLKAAESWSPQALTQLSLLALRARQQANDREAITVTGDPQQISSVLEASFLAVPTSLRNLCTFDTYFYRCNLVATYFWAIGLPEPPVSVKFVHVNGQSRQLQGELPGQPEMAYERWVAQAIESRQLAEIARHRNSAHALGEWLDGRAYDLSLLDAASTELIAAVFKASPSSVQDSLRRAVTQKVPSELAGRAAHYIFKQMSGPALYRQLRQGFELDYLLKVLYSSYQAEEFKEPPKQEVKAMEALLERADHPILRLVLAYWDNPRKQLPKALERAEEDDYRQFVAQALKFGLTDPLTLLVPGRGEVFLDLYLTPALDDLPDLVESLIEIKEFSSLDRLTMNVFKQSRKDLKKLQKLIDDEPEVPESFRQAVTKAIEALPPEGGIKGALKSVWRKLPGGSD